jgi:hypothetical protein
LPFFFCFFSTSRTVKFLPAFHLISVPTALVKHSSCHVIRWGPMGCEGWGPHGLGQALVLPRVASRGGGVRGGGLGQALVLRPYQTTHTTPNVSPPLHRSTRPPSTVHRSTRPPSTVHRSTRPPHTAHRSNRPPLQPSTAQPRMRGEMRVEERRVMRVRQRAQARGAPRARHATTWCERCERCAICGAAMVRAVRDLGAPRAWAYLVESSQVGSSQVESPRPPGPSSRSS